MRYTNIYKYHEGQIEVDGEIKNVTNKFLDGLRHKNVLTQQDLQYMKMMRELEIFNRQNFVRYSKAQNSADMNDTTDKKKLLRKYLDLGILNRFYVSYANERGQTPNFYKLSVGAYKYISKYYHLSPKPKYIGELYSLDMTLRKLSLNQTQIAVESFNENYKWDIGLYRRVKRITKGTGTDLLTYTSSQKHIIIDSVRRTRESEKLFIEKQKQLSKLLLNVKEGKEVHLIAICEDDLHCEELNRVALSEGVSNMLAYSTDNRVFDSGLMNNLLLFEYQKDNQSDFTMLQVDRSM